MEIPGTADNVGLLGEDAVIVTDYKSGWAGHVPPAREHFALKVYALFAARRYGRSRAVIAIIRVPDDGQSRVDRAELDALELDAVEERLVAIVRAVLVERAEYRVGNTVKLAEGEHCRWCPAFAACPAKMALAATLGRGEYDGAIITKENAAEVWVKLQGARAVLDRIEEAVKTLAALQPIPLGDGRVLAPVEKTRESISDADKALAVLRDFDVQVAEDAIERSTSKSAIRRALTRARERKNLKVTAVERELLAQMREAGACRTTRWTHVEPVEPAKEEVANGEG
jgi:hypothetical protein